MMVARRVFPQPDLFGTPRPRMMLAPAMRTSLVDQLTVLLLEAMATPEGITDAQDRWEAGNDENHG
jgi:hypothetical protein